MLEVIQTNAFADWFDGLKDVNAKGRIRAASPACNAATSAT
jgi:hypothetical protein